MKLLATLAESVRRPEIDKENDEKRRNEGGEKIETMIETENVIAIGTVDEVVPMIEAFVGEMTPP